MDIFVPDIGTDEVEVTEVLVAVGDVITEEQPLISVEGDKASMEVPAPTAGTVSEIKIKVGDKVSTGSLMMVFAADNAASAPAAEAAVEKVAETTAPATTSALQAVYIPDIGDDEVEVTEMLVAVGDAIDEEQALFTVEGDKASMEVPAPFAGTLSSIEIQVGDKVKTGQLVMHFAVGGAVAAESSSPVATSIATPVASTQTIELIIPDIGGDEVEVTEVLVSVGDEISEEQALITVEGDKASMEVPASHAGKLVGLSVQVGDKVSTGSLIGQCEVNAPAASTTAVVAPSAPSAPATNPAPTPASPQAVANEGFVENQAYAHASPVIRRLAREFGVNLAKVKGSGRKGRVVREDVQAYIKQAVAQVEQGKVSSNAGGGELDLLPWPSVDFAKFGEVTVEKLSRIKKISGANLHRNWVKIPHVTQFDEADITELEAFRKAENAMAAKLDTGVKVTPLVLIMKAVAKSLLQFPTFNASLSEDGESLVLKQYVHIGIAVDTPNGLVVPVIRNVDQKGVHQLSQELIEISKKARAGKLTASDMQGGCFSISSLGGLGGTAFTPIVNAPEVAILGVSKTEMKPKWNGKDFEPRLMLPLSLSYDHRVIDGALAAKFTSYLGSVLADLRKLIL